MDSFLFIPRMKAIQLAILNYIDEEEETEEKYQNLIKLLNDEKIGDNYHELKSFLYLIQSISNHHYRSTNFFDKITQILRIVKDQIKTKLSNSEIFKIFQKNKRIILILKEEDILQFDKLIANSFVRDIFQRRNYHVFFFEEIKPFIDAPMIRRISKIEFPKNFDEKRRIGENENDYCEIIRKDSIEEFIIYVNKQSFSLETVIKTSIFETNPLFFKKEPSLIEYAAFYGSNSIFTYLYKNGVELKSSLWNYAIHGNNPELIHLLVEKNIEPERNSYNICLKEAIKCHHNDIADYILNNYFNQDIDYSNFKENIISYSFRFYNFNFFPENLDNSFIFFYACQFDYFIIVEFLLKTKKININDVVKVFFN